LKGISFYNKISLKKISVIFLSVILLTSIPALQSAYAVTFSFSSEIDLSNDGASDTIPQIVASGNDIYVVFQKATGSDIYFTNSTDGGTSFDAAVNLSQSGGTISDRPQISVSGNNIYVVWEEGSDVVVGLSTDNGNTPPSSTTTLSSGSASRPQINASGSNVQVAFRDGTDIILSTSTDSGSSYTSDNLSNSGPDSITPQLATTGSDAYVVWEESDDINLVKVSNNGVTVGAVQPISSSGGGANASDEPDVAASGNNVYVIWQEGTDIFVRTSTDAASSFGVATDIGDSSAAAASPQILFVGGNVFAVWRGDDSSENNEIMFSRSISGGAFSTPVNLSNTAAGLSFLPTIAASGSNVYVAWIDTNSGSNIIFRGSDDDGETFSSSLIISPTGPSGTSDEPRIAISGSDALVVFEDTVNGGDDDILFTKGTLSAITISFDKSPAAEYRLGEAATITIIDASESGNGSISATVTSSTGDTTGFSFTLAETGTLGTFENQINPINFTETLNSDSSINRLKANPGDIITVTHSSTQATANIFTRTVEWNSDTLLDRGDIAGIKVTDENSNTDSTTFQKVTVTVTTAANPSGISVILDETTVASGIFGGFSGESQIIFFKNDGLVPEDSTITITEQDTRSAGTPGALNTNATAIDTITEKITSTSEPGNVFITLIETGLDTGIFSGELTLSNIPSDNSTATLNAVREDILTITGQSSSSVARALVTPEADSQGAIKVTDIDTALAQIGPLSNPTTDSVSVLETLTGGGGGGGLVRPGLVVNVLAGAAGGGGGLPGPTITLGAVALSDRGSETISMPQEIRDFINDDFDPHTPLEPIIETYEDFGLPLSINGNGFALGGYENTLVPQTVKPGEPIEFTLVFYTNFEIAHTSLNFNLSPTRTIAGSDTQVLLYKDKFEIIDPNGNIATATGSINNEGDLKRVATFSITFSDDIQWSNSDLVIRSWNDNLNSGDIIVYDAIQVLPSEEEIAFESSIPEPEVEQLKSQYVPIWIKNNAAWWSQQLIEDSDFVAGIEYLIQNEIITIQDNQIITSYSSNEIPSWIKNNAGWWSEDLITEKEFIDGLQWLISNGIIQVTET